MAKLSENLVSAISASAVLALADDVPFVSNYDVSSSFSNAKPIFTAALREIIMSSPFKNYSLDPVPSFLIKKIVDILLPSMTTLVYLSLSTGVFPESMKCDIVKPLLKKTSLDPSQKENH